MLSLECYLDFRRRTHFKKVPYFETFGSVEYVRYGILYCTVRYQLGPFGARKLSAFLYPILTMSEHHLRCDFYYFNRRTYSAGRRIKIKTTKHISSSPLSAIIHSTHNPAFCNRESQVLAQKYIKKKDDLSILSIHVGANITSIRMDDSRE